MVVLAVVVLFFYYFCVVFRVVLVQLQRHKHTYCTLVCVDKNEFTAWTDMATPPPSSLTPLVCLLERGKMPLCVCRRRCCCCCLYVRRPSNSTLRERHANNAKREGERESISVRLMCVCVSVHLMITVTICIGCLVGQRLATQTRRPSPNLKLATYFSFSFFTWPFIVIAKRARRDAVLDFDCL